MVITKELNGTVLTYKLEGKLDTTTAEDLRAEIATIADNVTSVIFDLDKLTYIASSGLRQILATRKRFKNDSDVKVINCNEVVYSTFIMTGFESMMEIHEKDSSALEDVDVDNYDSMGHSYRELLAHRVEKTPNFPFLKYGDTEYTWEEIDKCSQIIASDLIKMGVKKFSHVGILSINTANFVITFFALQKIGAIAMLLNFNYKYPELVDLANIGDITHLCVGETTALPEFNELKSQLLADKGCNLEGIYDISNSVDFRERLSEYDSVKDLTFGPVSSDDTCAMIFSSGSTGKPKGILLSAYSIMHGAKLVIQRATMNRSDSCCLILPMFHIFGIKDGLTLSAMLNNRFILPINNKTDTIINVVEKEKVTLFHSVPTMMLAILNNKNFSPEKFASVRITELAGAAMAEAQMRMLMRTLPNDHFICAYGLSELAPVSITEYGDTVEHLCTSVGRPAEDVQVRINDPATGKDVPNGQRGEILVYGKNLMTCYYKRCADDQAIDSDGWLHTGDLGVMDNDGYLHIVGRIKEIIIRGGENIIPNEIASAMSEHDNVHDDKVIGIPDDFYGEVVGACVTLHDRDIWDEEEMNEFLSSRIAKYKIPSHYMIFDEFPTLPNGKVDGVTMKELLIEDAKKK